MQAGEIIKRAESQRIRYEARIAVQRDIITRLVNDSDAGDVNQELVEEVSELKALLAEAKDTIERSQSSNGG